ncbi:MAG: Rieske (2Fe-2S) protein [Ignavibacteriales bacterium]|nr:Rieske (2Fe-2S) protein [Ignavibacteriales bacterium]
MQNQDQPTLDHRKRDFLKYLLGGSFVAWVVSIFYPVLAYLKPPKQGEVEVSSVKVGKIEDIQKDSGQIVKFGNKPVILVRKPNGEFRSFSATCTHLDCTVQYRSDMGVIWCACHNGKYDLNGRNIEGPPPRPLEEFRVVMQGDEVLISKNV